MRKLAPFLIFGLALVSGAAHLGAQAAQPDAFIVRPYVQIGPYSNDGVIRLQLMWHSSDAGAAAWTVEYGEGFTHKANVASRKVELPQMDVHGVFRADLDEGLKSGSEVAYRVSYNGKAVFEDKARAPKKSEEDQSFAIFGDCGRGTKPQMALAKQLSANLPDYAMITGDIVYPAGTASQYRKFFYPYYDTPEVPIMSKIPFVAAPGNHDTAYGGASDAFAYFYYWSQPLNGPLTKAGERGTAKLFGSAETKTGIQNASGESYPRMATYSFDYGTVHWAVLDSNTYVDWRQKNLRDWLENDLKSAKNATWRFVMYHHPPFHSSEKHQQDRQMRSITDLMAKYKVDIVFSGHVHNYQRSYPMTPDSGVLIGQDATDWGLDRRFDGKTETRAGGPIYIVAGGGGAEVYDPSLTREPDKWNPFTAVYKGTNAMSFVTIKGRTLKMRTVDSKGDELDNFTLSKG